MTRGRCGPLIRHRPTLSLVSRRRFIPAHGEKPMSKSPQSTSPNPKEPIIKTPRPASASALLRHFADLRDGTHGGPSPRRVQERLFSAALPLLDPHAPQAPPPAHTQL